MQKVAGEPVSAHDVAAEIRQRLPGVPTVKLHKLLFYCQGHHIGTFDVPLFSETISAWDMGPVVGGAWFSEKNGREIPARRGLAEAQLNTVGYVLSRYGALTGKDLETLSHHQSPWQRADAIRQPKGSTLIRTEWIREFFVEDVEDYEIPLDSDVVRQWLAGAQEPPPAVAGESDDMQRLTAMRNDLVARTGRA